MIELFIPVGDAREFHQTRLACNTKATVIGAVFILVGIVGFLSPELMGAHLGPVHNVVHLVSGAASLYFGTKGTLASARSFCIERNREGRQRKTKRFGQVY